MISLEDCVAMCGLSREEVAAIAEHEHVPEVAAIGLATQLLNKMDGEQEICLMLVDDIREALVQRKMQHASELFAALRNFLDSHPDAATKMMLPNPR